MLNMGLAQSCDVATSGGGATAPPFSERPGLVRCKAEKAKRRKVLAQFFAQWCRRKGVTSRDLVAWFGCSKHVADQILTGRYPLHWEDLFSLTQATRNELYLGAEVAYAKAAEEEERLRSEHAVPTVATGTVVDLVRYSSLPHR